MAFKATQPENKVVDAREPEESGYAAWKRDKIELGLMQANDRSCLISLENVLDFVDTI